MKISVNGKKNNNKREKRLKARQASYDLIVKNDRSGGGKGFKKPGSLKK